jgi:succinate dehydrogenase hydrophobic anchor subunit
MDIRGVHPWRIMMFTGVIGLIFVFILLSFATLFPCNTIDNVINTLANNTNRNIYKVNGEEIDLARQICLITKYDNDTKQLQFYYDNFISFINEYNENNSNSIINESTIKIELFLVIPIYFVMNLVINISNIMIIRYLDPNIIFINSNFVYFIEEIIFYFFIIQRDDKYKTFYQFFFTELKQIFSLIGNIIYIELIELRFCKFDYDLRKNIKSRGERENSLGIV